MHESNQLCQNELIPSHLAFPANLQNITAESGLFQAQVIRKKILLVRFKHPASLSWVSVYLLKLGLKTGISHVG